MHQRGREAVLATLASKMYLNSSLRKCS